MSAPQHLIRYQCLLVVATGEVVQKRIRPAAARLQAEGHIRGVVYTDLHDRSPFDLGISEHYLRVLPKNRLALRELERLGFLGPETCAVVAAPDEFHLDYAGQLLPVVGRVGVEKPLTLCPTAALRLLDLPQGPHTLGHMLFKQATLQHLADCRARGAGRFRGLTEVRVELLEARGLDERRVSPAEWDLGWHALELLTASFRAAGWAAQVEVEDVRTAAYRPAGAQRDPDVSTAARLTGRVMASDRPVSFDLRMGKGLGVERKVVQYKFADAAPVVVDVSESGWRAHYRLLKELLTADHPDLGLDLSDAVEVVQVCAAAQVAARDAGRYPFGELPEFLSPAGVALPSRI